MLPSPDSLGNVVHWHKTWSVWLKLGLITSALNTANHRRHIADKDSTEQQQSSGESSAVVQAASLALRLVYVAVFELEIHCEHDGIFTQT